MERDKARRVLRDIGDIVFFSGVAGGIAIGIAGAAGILDSENQVDGHTIISCPATDNPQFRNWDTTLIGDISINIGGTKTPIFGALRNSLEIKLNQDGNGVAVNIPNRQSSSIATTSAEGKVSVNGVIFDGTDSFAYQSGKVIYDVNIIEREDKSAGVHIVASCIK